MSRRDNFVELLKKHGYNSINDFCRQNKLIQSNVNNRAKNEDLKVDLSVLFTWANLLHEPIITLIEIFYPEEMEQNKASIE